MPQISFHRIVIGVTWYLPAMQETQVQSLGWKIHWKSEWQLTSVFLPGEFHGQRSLADYIIHGVAKSQTGLND